MEKMKETLEEKKQNFAEGLLGNVTAYERLVKELGDALMFVVEPDNCSDAEKLKVLSILAETRHEFIFLVKDLKELKNR